MSYEWNESKRLSNLRRHGVDFDDIEEFDWQEAQYRDDLVVDHEQRFKAVSHFRGRMHVVIFTLRGDQTRIISFRRAEKREIRQYEKEKGV
jgi:uncharacterized protein